MKNNFVLILFLFLISSSFAQDKSTIAKTDSNGILNPGVVLMRSIIFPGFGQVAQERLWTASLYYGVSLTYYLKSVVEYQSYLNTSENKYLKRFNSNVAIAGITHLINIADAYYFAYIKNTKSWQSSMFSDKPLKSPWGATLRSAMFPGWGQWYNESYVKSALYLGAVIYLANGIIKYNDKYEKTGLEKHYDDYSRFSWYTGFTYVLMLADAQVDAYLFKFDETVDLTISFSPQSNTPLVGFYWSF